MSRTAVSILWHPMSLRWSPRAIFSARLFPFETRPDRTQARHCCSSGNVSIAWMGLEAFEPEPEVCLSLWTWTADDRISHPWSKLGAHYHCYCYCYSATARSQELPMTDPGQSPPAYLTLAGFSPFIMG